jgi:hypothetical protein
MAVKDCEQTWSGNAYRRLYPAYRTSVQIAAKVSFPRSLSNVAHGPLPPLATTSKCCSAARHCGHSCILQHFLLAETSVLQDVPDLWFDELNA